MSTTTPVIVSTWSFGTVANQAGWDVLQRGGSAMDAVVAAASAVEEDPSVDSVGYGGLPDASGRVSLDACVMESPARGGAVCCLRRHVHAAAIARHVMDHTIHMMLVGEDADAFADRAGFSSADLLAPSARRAWEEWRAADPRRADPSFAGQRPLKNAEEARRRPAPHSDSSSSGAAGAAGAVGAVGEPRHDTVCILALDAQGRLAGACSTSGLAFKVPGRVGDSPIFGHGLYVDPRAGAAAATGVGERVMGTCASVLAVERMRAGAPPLDALLFALQRIRGSGALQPDEQVAMIALTPDGRFASAALEPGFVHTVTRAGHGTVQAPAMHVLADGGACSDASDAAAAAV